MGDTWSDGTLSDKEIKALETLIDTTKSVSKVHHANDIMSSLLAKIRTLAFNEDEALGVIITRIRDLLDWYDMYQAGVLEANITGKDKK
jgi:hypothetical protein